VPMQSLTLLPVWLGEITTKPWLASVSISGVDCQEVPQLPCETRSAAASRFQIAP
jgi:hypothetical protein